MSTNSDVGHQVMGLIERLGVSPLIRNYHLFYTCIANCDQKLRRAVRNLGRNPTQSEVDQVIDEFCPEASDSPTMRRHNEAVLRTLEEIGARLRSEQSEMKNFNGAMDRVTQALSKSIKEENITIDVLKRVAATVVDVGMHRISSSDRMLSRMDENKTEINTLRTELVKAKAMANTDPLTGLANRRSFDEHLAATFSASRSFCLILLDIDFFKRVNDTYGHPTGDLVIRTVAEILRRAIRAGTFAARTGGEEFAIALEGASDKEAMTIGERIRMAVEKTVVSKGEEKFSVTVSLGAAMSTNASAARLLYEAADGALYRSKSAGRNRLTFERVNDNEDSSDRYQLYKG
jgi:diguanylate cyclase